MTGNDWQKVFWAVTFWDRVKEVEGGCWEWQGRVDDRGFGRTGDDRPQRRAYALATGELLLARVPILHDCVNPLCCNPGHLRKGRTRE